jgi:hypothetical protein
MPGVRGTKHLAAPNAPPAFTEGTRLIEQASTQAIHPLKTRSLLVYTDNKKRRIQDLLLYPTFSI